MSKFILTAALVTALVGFAGTAQADMGIPNIPAQPLTTQTTVGVVGETMPVFNGTPSPVVAETFTQATLGERAPTFAAPADNGANGTNGVAYAQIGRINRVVPMALADGARLQQPNG